jgi:hypothetical protein
MTQEVADIDYMKQRVTIPLEKYIELLKDEELLRRLDSGGVDNWDWYGDSLNPDNEPSYDEFCTELDKKFKR